MVSYRRNRVVNVLQDQRAPQAQKCRRPIDADVAMRGRADVGSDDISDEGRRRNDGDAQFGSVPVERNVMRLDEAFDAACAAAAAVERGVGIGLIALIVGTTGSRALVIRRPVHRRKNLRRTAAPRQRKGERRGDDHAGELAVKQTHRIL